MALARPVLSRGMKGSLCLIPDCSSSPLSLHNFAPVITLCIWQNRPSESGTSDVSICRREISRLFFFFFNIKKNIFQGVRALNHTAFLTPLEFPKISHPLFKKFSSAWTQTCEQLTIRVVFILNTSGKDYMIRFMCNNN